ncbi:acyclic terpene utilization AtuA family protein [Nocardia nova]|uniref:acyclic terpene utilization AtuA family protein n=1 Tax=Nocardia nova TaxID=37330 RepID=UPI000CEA1929|nr:acyclic terpene utilization AtuA family protein [Nocardia nova]PPI93230.1 terpene utilization protein AtuA [Nocardia nova]
MRERTVTIGGAAGMWGDSYLATPQLLADGRCDYLIYEGLAEITMAILTKARMKDPAQGYTHDLIATIGSNLRRMRESGVKVVTNAGGVNPQAAAERLRALAAEAGVEVCVAAVDGDDLLPRLDRMRELDIREMSGGTPIPDRPISMNAYLGARPIAAALGAGADVVITGRCADSALALGPLIHEFGWEPEEFDKLSAGSLAGHLIECGPQSTGGLLTDWEDTPSWANSGFPIVMVRADGSFEITAPEGTDALVDRRTVTEQMLYEIGDPAAYLLPDVTCDWTQVVISEVGPNRVEVRGARGVAPTPTLKACAQVSDGHRTQVQFFVGGRDAARRGRRAAQDLLTRGRKMFADKGFDDFRDTLIEIVGAEDTYGANAGGVAPREVWVRLAVRHGDPAALTAFVREFPSIGLGGPCGMGGVGAGLPTPSPVLRLESFLVPRELLTARIDLDGRPLEPAAWSEVPQSLTRALHGPRGTDVDVADEVSGPSVELPLIAVAFGRSGDKGDSVNIGIAARHPDFEPIIQAQVTADRAGAYLAHLGASRVDRFVLPGTHAVNFLLHHALGGGGTASLRIDPQGKAAAQQLLDLPVRIPAALLAHPALAAIPEVDAARNRQ